MKRSPTAAAQLPIVAQRGFTLVEAICTMCVLGVIGVISSRLVLSAGDQYLSASVHAELSNELSAAMERLVSQIRQVPIRPASAPPVPDLTGVTTNSIAWNDASGEACKVTLQGSQLIWTEGSQSAPLLEDVAQFSIACLDDDAAALPAALMGAETEAVRRISITMALQKSGVTESLRTTIFLRAATTGAASQ